MKFYHWTSEACWEAIQKEGVLFGKPWYWNDEKTETRYILEETYRYTYLAPLPDLWNDDGSYGSVLLEVEYEPKREDFGKKHNYGFDPPPGEMCVQFSIFEPIPLTNVRRINNEVTTQSNN